MRLAYLLDRPLPSRAAHGVHVMKMCAALARAGAEVQLVLPGLRLPGAGTPELYARYGVPANFEVVPAPGAGGAEAGSYRYAWAAARWCRRTRPELVYGRAVPACVLAGLLGQRVALELHEPPRRLPGWVLRGLLRRRWLAGLVTISEALATHLLAPEPGLRGRCLVAMDAADPVPAAPEPGAGAPGGRLRVGYVGHLYPGKGMELIAELAPRCPGQDFVVVGGTPEDLALWRARVGGVANLELVGYRPPAEVPGWLAGFDVLLAPYQAEVRGAGGGADLARWMSPLKLFEGMAAGKPILCSDLPVLREALAHDETGWLLPPGDPAAWAAALARLAAEPATRARLGAAARVRFEAHHSWDARARRVLAWEGTIG